MNIRAFAADTGLSATMSVLIEGHQPGATMEMLIDVHRAADAILEKLATADEDNEAIPRALRVYNATLFAICATPPRTVAEARLKAEYLKTALKDGGFPADDVVVLLLDSAVAAAEMGSAVPALTMAAPTMREGLRQRGDLDKIVAARLKAFREARGVSQTKLGAHLGVTSPQIQKYEKGTNRIGAGALWRLAELLDVPVARFFDIGEEEVAPAAATPTPRAEKVPMVRAAPADVPKKVARPQHRKPWDPRDGMPS